MAAKIIVMIGLAAFSQTIHAKNDIEKELGSLRQYVHHLKTTVEEYKSHVNSLDRALITSNAKLDEYHKKVTSLEVMNITSIGTTYVRWGRTECPATAQLVYHGYSGKSHLSQGGGADYQCLHPEPEWPAAASEGFQSGSSIYGVEYQDSAGWREGAHNQDAPCALCNVESRTRQVMIPGRETCPEGWVREYYGFLVAQHNTHMSSTFACLDIDFEYLPGGSADQNGGLFYMVETQCGPLPCPPYVSGMELSCVVCTK